MTGAAGQIGSAVLSDIPKSVSVRGLARSDMDLADPAAIRRVLEEERPDWLINCAAYTSVDKAESEPELARMVNAEAVAVMAEALNGCGGRLLQLSTDCVFDGTAQQPYLPSDKRNPISIYGETKAMGEDAAGDESIILRVSWVYDTGHENFVTRMLGLMRERPRLQVVDDQVGSPSWAPDIARAIWALIAKGGKGVFHNCDAGETSRYGWTVAIAEEALDLGLIDSAPELVPVPSQEFPTPAQRPPNSVLDTRATQELLMCEVSPWRDNLRRMLMAERDHG